MIFHWSSITCRLLAWCRLTVLLSYTLEYHRLRSCKHRYPMPLRLLSLIPPGLLLFKSKKQSITYHRHISCYDMWRNMQPGHILNICVVKSFIPNITNTTSRLQNYYHFQILIYAFTIGRLHITYHVAYQSDLLAGNMTVVLDSPVIIININTVIVKASST